MVVVGVGVLVAKRLHGWRRVVPVLCPRLPVAIAGGAAFGDLGGLVGTGLAAVSGPARLRRPRQPRSRRRDARPRHLTQRISSTPTVTSTATAISTTVATSITLSTVATTTTATPVAVIFNEPGVSVSGAAERRRGPVRGRRRRWWPQRHRFRRRPRRDGPGGDLGGARGRPIRSTSADAAATPRSVSMAVAVVGASGFPVAPRHTGCQSSVLSHPVLSCLLSLSSCFSLSSSHF